MFESLLDDSLLKVPHDEDQTRATVILRPSR